MRILILLGLLLALLYLVLSGGGVALFKVIGDPTMSILMTLYVIAWVVFLRLALWVVRYKWPAPATANTDEVVLREISRMLERMEHRIESLETILLDREARVKRTAERD
jgi:phage shock protein B